jgi:predicted tellurium resistance membrane protein TerC
MKKMVDVKIGMFGIFGVIGFSLLLAFSSSEIGNNGLATGFIIFAIFVVTMLFAFGGKRRDK